MLPEKKAVILIYSDILQKIGVNIQKFGENYTLDIDSMTIETKLENGMFKAVCKITDFGYGSVGLVQSTVEVPSKAKYVAHSRVLYEVGKMLDCWSSNKELIK